MSRFSWLGGNSTPKQDEQSVRRARRHRHHATKTDRKAGAAVERRARRPVGD